ncbi:MAG: hypothetical protein M3Q73_02215 [bacterium]|nr:hypothetical protein [bacterium]
MNLGKKLIIAALGLGLSFAPLSSIAQTDIELEAAANMSVENRGKGNAKLTASTTASTTIKAKLNDKKATSTPKDRGAKGTTTNATSTKKMKLVELKTKLDAQKQTQVKKRIAHKVSVYEKAINQIEDLSKRVDSRIAKFEAAEADVALAKARNATAKTKIAEARALLASVKIEADAAVASSTPQKAIPNVIKTFAKVKESIKAAHAAVVNAIKALKGTKMSIEGTATSTATTTKGKKAPKTATTTTNITGTTTASTTTQ